MDYDNSDTLFSHYSVPRGLGMYLDGSKPIEPLFGGKATPKMKNRTTRRNIRRNEKHSRKQHTK